MDINIRKGKDSDRVGIAETFIEAFYETSNLFANQNKRFFLSQPIHPDRFRVALAEDRVVGIVGIAEEGRYPISVFKKLLKKEFGFIKGSLAANVLSSEFYRPKTFRPQEGHLLFVGVREEFRGQGIAKEMLKKIFEEESFKLYSLDVVSGNEKVIPLYEKAGFKIIKKDSSKNSRRPGIKFRYLMEKKVEN